MENDADSLSKCLSPGTFFSAGIDPCLVSVYSPGMRNFACQANKAGWTISWKRKKRLWNVSLLGLDTPRLGAVVWMAVTTGLRLQRWLPWERSLYHLQCPVCFDFLSYTFSPFLPLRGFYFMKMVGYSFPAVLFVSPHHHHHSLPPTSI